MDFYVSRFGGCWSLMRRVGGRSSGGMRDGLDLLSFFGGRLMEDCLEAINPGLQLRLLDCA